MYPTRLCLAITDTFALAMIPSRFRSQMLFRYAFVTPLTPWWLKIHTQPVSNTTSRPASRSALVGIACVLVLTRYCCSLRSRPPHQAPLYWLYPIRSLAIALQSQDAWCSRVLISEGSSSGHGGQPCVSNTPDSVQICTPKMMDFHTKNHGFHTNIPSIGVS